jgi:hypothetical protein
METRHLAWIFCTGSIAVATFMTLNLSIGVVVCAIPSRIADELLPEADRDHSLVREATALRGTDESVSDFFTSLQSGRPARRCQSFVIQQVT